MVIRNAQLAVLNEQRINQFKKILKKHIYAHFGEIVRDLSPSQFEFFVTEGINKAHSYDLDEEYHICVFFNVMLSLGADFENSEHHFIPKRFLLDRQITAEEKVKRLIDLTNQALKR